jgi:hypothetical protein
MQVIIVELIKTVELENHDSLIQPAACGQGIDGLDLRELVVNFNEKITNVSFMKNLKKLDASFNCGIDQNGVDKLDLMELNIAGNKKITNVSFMKNLKKINASFNCGIDQDG